MHIDLKNNSKQFKILIVFLLCFVYYGNSILNEYAFDDFIVVTQNSFTNSGIEGIPKIFANDSWVGCFGNDLKFVVGGRYRPLSIATFALENEFFGSNPYVSHFINVLLFAITAILLYLLISKVFKTISTNKSLIDFPFLATLLFIAHPIHTEVVANIKGRDEILALLGSLAAILSILKYIDSQKIYYFLLSFLCFLVAIFSKENAVTFLAIIPLTIYFYKNVSFKKHLIALAPAVIACIIFFIARKLAIGNTVSPPENFITNPFINATTVEKFATIFYTLGLYIKLLIFPHPLTLDYYPNHIKILSFINFYVILSVVVYLLLVFYAICNF